MHLIALHKGWTGQTLDSGSIERTCAALAAFSPLHSASTRHHDAVLACASPRRGWRPQHLPDGSVLLFTGRISNRRALAGELGLGNADDDAALYAAGLARWGDVIDLKVVGEYCAVQVGQHHVRMVRSPFGAPPLHYVCNQDHLIAATTPRALFATGLLRQELDEQKIADSLFLNYHEGERSWFKGIRRLPLGCRAVASTRGVTLNRFYDPFAAPQVRLASDDAYVEAVETLMHEALAAAMQDCSRPAISISGGLDSQAVACFALEAGHAVHGYTSIPEPGWDGRDRPGRFGDEQAHVEAFAAMHPGFTPHWITAAGRSFDYKLQSIFMAGSVAPRNSANLHWIHDVSAQARADGCDVVLNGGLGNATFSFDGRGAIPGWLKSGDFGRLVREVRASRTPHSGFWRTFAREAIMPLLPDALWHPIANRNGSVDDPLDSWSPIHPDWADGMQVRERAEDMGFVTSFRKASSTLALRRAMLSGTSNEGGDLELAFKLIHNIERRDALRYRPLIEFCLGIPDDQYLRDGQSRWLARRLLKGRVPDMVRLERRRGDQAADWHLRMSREREALLDEVEQLAGDPVMASRLNLAAIRDVLINWPAETPLKGPQLTRARLAVSRGLTTARFIRFVEGRNSP